MKRKKGKRPSAAQTVKRLFREAQKAQKLLEESTQPRKANVSS